MDTLAVIVAVVWAAASIGLAAWLWLAMDDVGGELCELAGFKVMRLDD
jgi:hypothetical protein